MLTKPISICVMLAGAFGIFLAIAEGNGAPIHCTVLACGSFLVGAGLIAIALSESANKK